MELCENDHEEVCYDGGVHCPACYWKSEAEEAMIEIDDLKTEIEDYKNEIKVIKEEK